MKAGIGRVGDAIELFANLARRTFFVSTKVDIAVFDLFLGIVEALILVGATIVGKVALFADPLIAPGVTLAGAPTKATVGLAVQLYALSKAPDGSGCAGPT